MTKKQSDNMWDEVDSFKEKSRSLNKGEGLSHRVLANRLKPIFKKHIKNMSTRQLRNIVLEYIVKFEI